MISLIIPCYNEEESVPLFYEEATKVLASIGREYELLFVNDGSVDNTGSILKSLAANNPAVKLVEFARNFGHEAAMIAGIDYAQGDYLICMDSDLQHPPKMLPAILQKFEEGFDVVSMVRTDNPDAGLMSKFFSRSFYKLLNLLSPVKFEKNSSDFMAFSKPVADVLRTEYREKVRYLRGYVQSVGFKRTTLEFKAAPRAAGKSKYNFSKLLTFSIHTLCGFSDMPLKLGLYTGITVAFFGLLLMIYSIWQKIFNDAPAGYSTLISALCFLFAVTLFVIGVIGEYISILLAEVKDRPIYIVKETHNVNDLAC